MPLLEEHGLLRFRDGHDFRGDWAAALSRQASAVSDAAAKASWDEQLKIHLQGRPADSSGSHSHRSLQAADNGDYRITERTDGNPQRCVHPRN